MKSLRIIQSGCKGGPFPLFGRHLSLAKTLADGGDALKAVPLTASEISLFSKNRKRSPIQIDGRAFERDIKSGILEHFVGYSDNFEDYERFALSSVNVRSKMVPYMEQKDYGKLTVSGHSIVQDIDAHNGSYPHHGNGVIIGDDGLFSRENESTKLLTKTAYHNVAQCRDENLDPVDPDTIEDKHKCIKMEDFEVVHPFDPSNVVPAKVIDYDIARDVAILEMEREIECTRYMNVTKDDKFKDMLSQNMIENIIACAVNNDLQFSNSFQKGFQKNVVVGKEGEPLYGPPNFHCFLGLSKDKREEAYAEYFKNARAYHFIDQLLQASQEGDGIWAHQLATLVGYSGCGISIVPTEILGVEIRDTWDTTVNPPIWKYSNAGRMDYGRIIAILADILNRKKTKNK